VLVDVIFRSIGDIYVDAEMLERAEMREFKGSRLRMITPEDLLLYAESTDLAVPITALRDLLNQLYPTTSWDEG
jgi:predicted nucleotidyltransferase